MFSNFEIPMFYRYEHYMSISHIALIVNMVQVRIHSAIFFFFFLPFRLDFFQSRTQPQKFYQTRKRQTTNMEEDTCLLKYMALFLYIDTLHEIFSPHTFYILQDTLVFSHNIPISYAHSPHAHTEEYSVDIIRIFVKFSFSCIC